MKKRKELKGIIKDLGKLMEIREATIVTMDRQICELFVEIRQVKADAFDLINHWRER